MIIIFIASIVTPPISAGNFPFQMAADQIVTKDLDDVGANKWKTSPL